MVLGLNWLDILLLIPLAYGLLHGLLHGFVRELSSILSVICGIIAAKFFAPQLASVVLSAINMPEQAALFLSYAALFAGVALVCQLVARLLTKFLRKLDLNWLNRLAGAIVGVFVWAMLLSVLLNLFVIVEPWYPVLKEEAKQQSTLYRPITDMAAIAKTQLEKYDLLPQPRS